MDLGNQEGNQEGGEEGGEIKKGGGRRGRFVDSCCAKSQIASSKKNRENLELCCFFDLLLFDLTGKKMATVLCRLTAGAVRDARKRKKEMDKEAGGHLRNSITKGGGTLTGFVAERGLTEVLKLVGCEAWIAGRYNFDVSCNKIKGEVKAKKTSMPPKSYYENSVCNHNAEQAADVYVFTRVQWEDAKNPDLGAILYFCGFVRCSELKGKARFLKEGDPDGDNGYICKADCWNLRIDECGDWQSLLAALGAPVHTAVSPSLLPSAVSGTTGHSGPDCVSDEGGAKKGTKKEVEDVQRPLGGNRLVKRRRLCASTPDLNNPAGFQRTRCFPVVSEMSASVNQGKVN